MLKKNCRKSRLMFTFAFFAFMNNVQAADSSACCVSDKKPFVFFPEIHMSADISRFLFPKNARFEKKYFLESDIFLEPVWLSYHDFFYFITSFESNLGMGAKRFVNVLFDPSDINWAITTTFEFRPRFLILQFGEDHRCFHEIDREPYPTVYWNMLYLAAASKTMRTGEYGRSVFAETEWTFNSRFSWYAKWGVFVKSLFGLVKDSNVDFENYRTNELMLNASYAAFSWQKMVFSIRSGAVLGWWDEPKRYGDSDRPYWRLTNGVEAAVFSGNASFSIFADFFLDDIPEYPDRKWFSRDRLVEIGIGFSL